MPTCAVSAWVVIFLLRFCQFLDQRGDGLVDAALQIHRIHAGGDRPGTLAHDSLRQHDRRGGAVAGDIVGLGGDLAHHLCAHVLELVGELDLFGDRHAVLGDARRAVTLVEDHVATLRAERDSYRLGERVDAAQHALAGIATEPNVLGSHLLILPEIDDVVGITWRYLLGLSLRAGTCSMNTRRFASVVR